VKALGAGIGSAVNLLDVDAVIIGGGLGVRFGEPFRRRIERQMRKHLFVDERPPDVLLAELGDLGGAVGAALLLAEGRN
jgi:glucokinase